MDLQPIPGKTMPAVTVVERDYAATYDRFTSLGPLMEKLGNGGKGIGWNTGHEVEQLGLLNGVNEAGRPRIDTDIDAAEVILSLAPETNGEVAVKAWAALEKQTGRRAPASRPAARGRQDPLPRPAGAAAEDHLPRRPGAGWRASMSATTPATPTCTS